MSRTPQQNLDACMDVLGSMLKTPKGALIPTPLPKDKTAFLSPHFLKTTTTTVTQHDDGRRSRTNTDVEVQVSEPRSPTSPHNSVTHPTLLPRACRQRLYV